MSYYRAQKDFNHIQDLNALDQLASSNYNAKEKQLSMMKNLLDELSGLIGGYNSSKIDAIAIRLQEQGYGCKQLERACKIIPERLDRFPSFKDLKTILSEFKEKKEVELIDQQAIKDRERFNGIKNLFMSKCTKDQLDSYVKWWLINVYELTTDQVQAFVSPNLFEMPALFDWYDNYCEWNLDRIKNVGLKKLQYLLKEQEKNYMNNEYDKKIEPMWINKNTEWKKYCEVSK